MDQPEIRQYKEEDKDVVLHLLRLNTPRYFSADEEKDLLYYLNHELEFYFIIEVNGEVVGCGGINMADEGTTGKISWDILHPDFQCKGLGRLLLDHRLALLKEMDGVRTIIVRTSQLAYRFYEKAGFELLEQVKDYWAPGFDLYKMKYRGW